MSRTLATNSGSVESLKVSRRCGCSPKARQIRPTLDVEMPECRAMLRVLQCVAPDGRLSNVCTMTLSSVASSILRGTPGRGSSSSPSRPRSAKRRRHFPTVCGGHPFARRHRLVAQPSGTAQHNARPQCQCLRRLAPLRVALQDAGDLGRHFDLGDRTTRSHPHPHGKIWLANYDRNFRTTTLETNTTKNSNPRILGLSSYKASGY